MPIYEYTVPMFRKFLLNLSNILDKADAFAKEKGMDEKELLDAQLAPDMFPFTRQIQMSCDNAKGATARLAGAENPKHEDTEASFAELKERIRKTLDFLDSVKPEQFAEAGTRKIVLPYFPDKHLMGEAYAKEYAIPNFLFHVVTAYDILRMKGLDIGKADYTGSLPFINN